MGTPFYSYYKYKLIFHKYAIIYRAIVYYFTTTISAVVLGIILVTTIGPGQGQSTIRKSDETAEQKPVYTADTLLDLVR